MSKIVAIGDIHAFYDKFVDLMLKLHERSDLDFERDTFVFLGDFVDGGPGARETITLLRQYLAKYPHWQVLLGNHEDLMLNALRVRASLCDRIPLWDYYLWFMQGGKETLDSYMTGDTRSDYEKAISQPKDVIDEEDLVWITERPLHFETKSFIFVHAGLEPGSGPEDTTDSDKLWIRDAFLKSDYDWGKRVIVGHTYHTAPLVRQNLVCIDTMHHGGGALTAAILDDDNPDDIEFVTSFFSERKR